MGLTGGGTSAFAQEAEFTRGNTGTLPAPPTPASFVSGSGATNVGSTVTVNAPASIVAGNLLVGVLYSANAGVSPGLSAPAGWTLAGSSIPGNSAGALGVWTKTAGSSEPTTYAFGGPAQCSAVVLQYSLAAGVDGTPAFTAYATTTTTPTAPSVTAVSSPDTWLAVFGAFSGTFLSTPPTGFTLRQRIQSAGNTAVSVYDKALTVAGATGTAAGGWTPDDGTVCSVLLHT